MKTRSFYEKIKFITGYHDVEVRGFFKGSAYQFHPHGICRDGILIYDHHNTNDYYTIAIAENPTAKWTAPANAPAAWGANALPKPIGCELITVWYSGEWRKEGPWVNKIEELVSKVESEIEIALELKYVADQKQKAANDAAKMAEDQKLKSSWQ